MCFFCCCCWFNINVSWLFFAGKTGKNTTYFYGHSLLRKMPDLCAWCNDRRRVRKRERKTCNFAVQPTINVCIEFESRTKCFCLHWNVLLLWMLITLRPFFKAHVNDYSYYNLVQASNRNKQFKDIYVHCTHKKCAHVLSQRGSSFSFHCIYTNVSETKMIQMKRFV